MRGRGKSVEVGRGERMEEGKGEGRRVRGKGKKEGTESRRKVGKT